MGRLVCLVGLVAACYHPTPKAGAPCSSEGDCPAGLVCDLSQVPPTCVDGLGDGGVADAPACTTAAQCPGTAPICDDATHICRGCIADTECSGACTEYNGQCVPEPKVIYVAETGADNGNCTMPAPCKTFNYALAQLTMNRRTIRVADGTYTVGNGSSPLSTNNTGGRIVFSGEDRDPAGAFLTAAASSTANPPVVSIGGSADVVLEGLTVRSGENDGVRNNGALLISRCSIRGNRSRGLDSNVSNSQPVHIWDSAITGNNSDGIYVNNGSIEVLRTLVAHNTTSGMIVNKAAATLVDSMFVRNGATAPYGGLRFQNFNGLPQTVSFVTVAYNIAGASNVAGISADNVLAIDNSIVSDNTNGTTSPQQICNGCTATYSLFSGTPPIGTGNLGVPADFVDPTNDDFHLSATSMARDAGDPAATVRIDFDGDPRPIGAGFDIGADEAQ